MALRAIKSDIIIIIQSYRQCRPSFTTFIERGKEFGTWLLYYPYWQPNFQQGVRLHVHDVHVHVSSMYMYTYVHVHVHVHDVHVHVHMCIL